jgi:hypothetical protein
MQLNLSAMQTLLCPITLYQLILHQQCNQMQGAGEKVGKVLKGGVRVIANGIEGVTDAVAKIAPDSIERSTVRNAV